MQLTLCRFCEGKGLGQGGVGSRTSWLIFDPPCFRSPTQPALLCAALPDAQHPSLQGHHTWQPPDDCDPEGGGGHLGKWVGGSGSVPISGLKGWDSVR
jgi:hypothetical protein